MENILEKIGYETNLTINRDTKEFVLKDLKLKDLNLKDLELVSLLLCSILKDKTELIDMIKDRLPYIVSYIKESNSKGLPIKDLPIKGLSYDANSCYMDSLLMSLFFNKNKFIDQEIFKDTNVLTQRYIVCKNEKNKDISLKEQQNNVKKIQTELKNIRRSIRGKNDIKNCSTLRTLINNCRGSQSFHKRTEQDAGEFLKYLFGIFNVRESMVIEKHIKYIIDSSVDKEVKNIYKSYPIIDITSTELDELGKKSYNLSSFINKHEKTLFDDKNLVENKYSIKIEDERVLESPIIIFNIHRIDLDKKFIKKKLYPSRILFLPGLKTLSLKTLSLKTLSLKAIVVHDGEGHYICYFNSKGNWYYYNDLNNGKCIELSYSDMLKNKLSPVTHGTLFFYL